MFIINETEPSYSKICIQCGHIVDRDAIFCQFCGSSQDTFIICQKCGARTPKDATFCSKCGNNLKITKNFNISESKAEENISESKAEENIPTVRTNQVRIFGVFGRLLSSVICLFVSLLSIIPVILVLRDKDIAIYQEIFLFILIFGYTLFLAICLECGWSGFEDIKTKFYGTLAIIGFTFLIFTVIVDLVAWVKILTTLEKSSVFLSPIVGEDTLAWRLSFWGEYGNILFLPIYLGIGIYCSAIKKLSSL